jgi:hypothetical protein
VKKGSGHSSRFSPSDLGEVCVLPSSNPLLTSSSFIPYQSKFDVPSTVHHTIIIIRCIMNMIHSHQSIVVFVNSHENPMMSTIIKLTKSIIEYNIYIYIDIDIFC